MNEVEIRSEAERRVFKRLITETYPSGVISIVSDTFDFWSVISKIAPSLKNEILARQKNDLGLAKVVFRPDSGNPVDVLCGIEIEDYTDECGFHQINGWVADGMCDRLSADTPHGECGAGDCEEIFKYDGKYYKAVGEASWDRHDKQYYYLEDLTVTSITEIELTPEQKGAVECLWDVFGGEVTDKGYKMLNERVGLIYGDSITLERAEQIMQRLMDKGFASTNVVFGIGSYTYQYNTRDSFGMALKATYGEVNGVGREIFKDPITDSGTKKSARGLLRVELENGEYVLYDQQTPEQEKMGELRTVFKNGKMVVDESLEDIRDRLMGDTNGWDWKDADELEAA